MKDSRDCADMQVTIDMACKRYKLSHEAPVRPLGADVKLVRLYISEDVSNRLHRELSEFSHTPHMEKGQPRTDNFTLRLAVVMAQELGLADQF